jgi:rod shape-determining protein MreB
MINLLAGTFRSSELAIDLGSSVTRVASRCGSLKVQPSHPAGRQTVRGGVVLDPEATVALLSPMVWESRRFGAARPRALACTPSHVSDDEREAVAECIRRAGASSVTLVPDPIAAAVGAGLNIGSGRTIFIVDMGEAVTDCAVIQGGRVVQSQAVRRGCGDLRRKLRQCARQAAHLEVDDQEAERLLRNMGFQATVPGKTECTGFRKGRVCEQRLARKAMFDAVRPMLGDILSGIKSLFRDLPVPMAIEVIEDGIYLTGGGALLHGVREHVAEGTKIDVHVVEDPLGAVVNGARAMLPFVR